MCCLSLNQLVDTMPLLHFIFGLMTDIEHVTTPRLSQMMSIPKYWPFCGNHFLYFILLQCRNNKDMRIMLSNRLTDIAGFVCKT